MKRRIGKRRCGLSEVAAHRMEWIPISFSKSGLLRRTTNESVVACLPTGNRHCQQRPEISFTSISDKNNFHMGIIPRSFRLSGTLSAQLEQKAYILIRMNSIEESLLRRIQQLADL